MAYTNTGAGMHRIIDPVDGETYLYAMSFPDQAQRIFAAFDQPDLKAPVTLTVTAPEHWTVAANGMLAATPRPGRWEFAPTPPLATYVVSLIAGPWHVRRGAHGRDAPIVGDVTSAQITPRQAAGAGGGAGVRTALAVVGLGSRSGGRHPAGRNHGWHLRPDPPRASGRGERGG